VQYYRNATNIGNPRNFNRVFELTKTPYLKWSTSDDTWSPTFLERALEIMEQDASIALCYPKTYLVMADNPETTPYEDGLHLVQTDPAERFLKLLDTIKLSHQHLGLVRTSALRRTHLLGAYVGSDINLLAELTLYGKFYELPERLFFRRFHETSGSWKRGDAQHESKHYHGTSNRQISLKKWRRHIGHFASIHASPLPIRSKAHVYKQLLRRLVWDRRELLGELAQYARHSPDDGVAQRAGNRSG
jgi:hypothetical protein